MPNKKSCILNALSTKSDVEQPILEPANKQGLSVSARDWRARTVWVSSSSKFAKLPVREKEDSEREEGKPEEPVNELPGPEEHIAEWHIDNEQSDSHLDNDTDVYHLVSALAS